MGFDGAIGRVHATSVPSWSQRTEPHESAPNILIVLCDDLGFSDLGSYGSEIDTPNLDALANEGLRYTNFHVNPMCSPTRASLLTGLNSHLAGLATVCHADPGFPGYAASIRGDAATLAEILSDNGWATLMVGKWHLPLTTPFQRQDRKAHGLANVALIAITGYLTDLLTFISRIAYMRTTT